MNETDAGTAETRWLDATTLETRFVGRITFAVASRARVAAFELVTSRPARYWIIDTSQISTFEPSVRDVGFRWLREFRQQGGTLTVVVVKSGAVRMLASALAFATGMSVRTVSTVDEASRLLVQHAKG